MAAIDALGHRTSYVYDANNRVTQITDPLGHTTQYRYDAVGNRTQVIDALGRTTTTYYHLDGEVHLVVDAEGERHASTATTQRATRSSELRYAQRVLGAVDPAQLPPACRLGGRPAHPLRLRQAQPRWCARSMPRAT